MQHPRQRPRRGWQRVTAKQTQPRSTRETFRRDAPSPAQEILARHDAELDAQSSVSEDADEDTEGSGSHIICF